MKTFDHRLKLHVTRKITFPVKQVEDFYTSPAWRAVRAEVLKRDSYLCACGRGETRMFVDHIIERKDGGADLDMANLVTCCGSCHTTKTLAERRKRGLSSMR